MMKKIILKNKAKKRLAHSPLIMAGDLLHEEKTKEWCQFITENQEYLGVGYLGNQHKAIGYIMTQDKETINQAYFIKLMQKSRARRQSFENNEAMTNAYRLFNAEGDGLYGLTIDYYNGYAVFSFYNETIYAHRKDIIAAFRHVYDDKVKGAVEKNRFQENHGVESQWIYGEKAEEPHFILENGITYPTYLNEGWMTGIFLDQHNVRARLVDGQACGLKVLNTFSYTGAFSLAAAMGGACHTVSVDLARRSLEKTKEVFLANHLSLENNQIVVMDIFDYIKWAKKKKLSFDMIILDPPSFARNGKKTFSVAKDYGRLVQSILPLLNKKGILIASTNAANVSLGAYRKMIEQAFESENRHYEEQFFDQLPEDFVVAKNYPAGNYLKVLTYEVKN